MIKPVAIIGFLGLIIIGSTQLKAKNEPLESVVVFEAPTLSPTPNVELTEEAPIETKTTNSVTPTPKPTKSSITLADLTITPTLDELAQQVDQNTIKNVEQDAKLEEHENKINEIINTPPPQPTPQPTPQPLPPPPPAPPADTTSPILVAGRYANLNPVNGYIYNSLGYDRLGFSTDCWNQGTVAVKFDEPATVTFLFFNDANLTGNGDDKRNMFDRKSIAAEVTYTSNLSTNQFACYQDLGLISGNNYWLGIVATDASGNTYREWQGVNFNYYSR